MKIKELIIYIKNGFNPKKLKSKNKLTIWTKSFYNWKIFIKWTWNVSIWSYCAFWPNLRIISSNHDYNYPFLQWSFIERDLWVKHPNKFIAKDVNIWSDVWTWDNVMIMPWVNIWNWVIIWAWAVVTKDIPDYAIIWWVPAKILKYRFNDDIISVLKEIKWWDWSLEKQKRNIEFFKTNLNKINAEELKKIIND